MESEVKEIFKLASKVFLNSIRDPTPVGSISYLDNDYCQSQESREISSLNKELSKGFECESERGIYKSNGIAMFISLSLGKKNIENLIKNKEGLGKIEAIKKLKSLEGKTILEIGGKRLSPTAYGLGAKKVIELDAGDETGEGSEEEMFSLKEYKKLVPNKVDMIFSSWALEDGLGYISNARFSPDKDRFVYNVDGLADVLAAMSNTSKENSYSIHTYSSPRAMKKFICGPGSDYLKFIGFNVEYYREIKDGLGDNCIVLQKKNHSETDEWSFLIRREESHYGDLKTSLLKKKNGEIIEEKLNLSMEEARKKYTFVEKKQGIPLILEN